MVRRLFWMVPTLFVVSVITFFSLNAIPGDIAYLYLGEEATPETIEAFRERHGLDRPVVERYVNWLGGMVTGNPGASLQGGRSIADSLAVRLPVTLHIVVFAMFFTVIFGVPFGLISAVYQDSWLDYVVRTSVVFGDSFPNFFLLTLLLLIPAILFSYGPPVGYEGPFWTDPVRAIRQFVPPALILGFGSAFLVRITRSSVLEVLRADFVRTARAKGVRERTVVLRHVMRNAMIPVITVLGGAFSNLLTGSVILENVMTLPGVGQYLLQAVQLRDFNVVQALTMYAAVAVMTANLLVDLSYAYLDPRIRYS